MVVAITDPILPADTGTYRIADDGVTRVNAPADLGIDMSALAACYLGGIPWRHPVLAGRATEYRSGVAMDGHPFSGTYFRPALRVHRP